MAFIALSPESADVQHVDVLASTLAVTGATLLGFVLTAVTILAALAQTQLLANMYRTGHARYLLTELFAAVALFLLVTIFAGLFILSPELLGRRFLYLSASYFGSAAAALISGGKHFYSVMMELGPTDSKSIQ